MVINAELFTGKASLKPGIISSGVITLDTDTISLKL